MVLEIQIQSLIFSFVFGLFFSLVYNLIYKHLYSGRLIFRVFINLIFVITNIIIYFIFLKIMNNGIIHTYFLIMLIIGFIVGNIKTRVIRKYKLEVF